MRSMRVCRNIVSPKFDPPQRGCINLNFKLKGTNYIYYFGYSGELRTWVVNYKMIEMCVALVWPQIPLFC